MKPDTAIDKVFIEISQSKSLPDYYMKLLATYQPQALGLMQEYFAFLYFNIHKSLFDVKDYVSYTFSSEKQIKKITDLGMPERDMGTDSVIFHNDGSISLVQIKWRTNKDKKHNRSVFDGMAIDGIACTAPLKQLILFTNCKDKTDSLPKTDKFKYILFTELVSIDWKFFKKSVKAFKNSSTNYKNGKKCLPIVPPLKLRDWQIKAKEFVEGGDNKYTIIAPCGTGKTLLGYALFSGLDKYKILIVVPSLQLLSQWFYVLAIREPDAKFVLVGSQADSKDIEVPYILSTDKKEIKKELKNSGDKLIVISTYQSLDIVNNIKFQFDQTIADEAHLTAGKGQFTTVTNETFQTDKKIFLTATPKVFKGQLKEICTSMDDESVYGTQFTYSTRQAINDNNLCNYQIFLPYYPMTFGKEKPNEVKLKAHMLNKHCEKYNLTKILVTSTNHASSKRIFEEFEKVYDGKSELILMKPNVGAKEKNEVLLKLEQGDIIIFSVNIFNLGVDMPSLQAVMFNDDRTSKIDIIQAAMRCMRIYSGKELAHIIVPAFMGDDLSDKDQACDYSMVRNTLHSLGNQDEALFEEIYLRIEAAKQGKSYTGSSKIIQFVTMDGEIDVSKIEFKIFDRMGKCLNGEQMALQKAKDCIAWYIEHQRLPKMIRTPKTDKERIECSFATWLGKQKLALNKKGSGNILYPSVKKLLDKEMPEWCQTLEQVALQKCRDCINWCKKYHKLPQYITKKNKSAAEIVEHNHAKWLGLQKKAFNGKGNIYDSVKKMLDEEIPEWCFSLEQIALQKCKNCILWCKQNEKLPSTKYGKKNITKEELIEHGHAVWLKEQKKASKGKSKTNIFYESVKNMLDKELPEWRQTKENVVMQKAKEYINLYKNLGRMPKRIRKQNKTEEECIEHKNAQWLNRQKLSLNDKGKGVIYPSVKKLLFQIPEIKEYLEN